MSAFGGTELINKLAELNIRGVEKLDKESIDWIFYDNKLQSVAKFFEWIAHTITYEDLLTDEELLKYNEILEDGTLLPAEYLDDIKKCLDSAGFDHHEKSLGTPIHDVENMEKDQKRKNQLCMQKMELQEEIDHQKERNASLEVDIQETISQLEKQANVHIKTAENLCSSVDRTIVHFEKFCNHQHRNANLSYLSQLDLCQWQKEEDVCRTSIQAYINKQFKQEKAKPLDEISPYCLLDSGKIDVDLAKTNNIAEYKSNVSELNRLSKMIELSEIRQIEAELEKTKFEAHINELENILKLDAITPTKDGLLEEHARLIGDVQDIEEQFDDQLKETLHNAKSVAAYERCKTISGDYKAKLQRQETYLRKQDFVTDSLLEQLSRHDFLRICLETEKKELSQMLNMVADLNQYFVDKSKQSADRQQALQSNENIQADQQYENIFENMDFQTGLKDSCEYLNEKMKEVNLKKKSYLNRMESLCSLLEKCLFKEGKSSITALPSSWLIPDLVDKSEKFEIDLWSFQQEMLGVIKSIETKKKILAVNPEISEEMLQWTKKFKQI